MLVGEHFVTCSAVELSSCFFLSGNPFQCTCVWVRNRLIGHKSKLFFHCSLTSNMHTTSVITMEKKVKELTTHHTAA